MGNEVSGRNVEGTDGSKEMIECIKFPASLVIEGVVRMTKPGAIVS